MCCDNCQSIEAAASSESSDEPSTNIGITDPNEVSKEVNLMKDQQESDVASDAAPEDCVLRTQRCDPSILPQRCRGAHLINTQTSLECWRAETWTHHYAGCPWSPEIILPSRVVSNISNKTSIQSLEALVEVGGWAQHRALVCPSQS